MAMEIQLINQIEKYEFLYNFNLAEYNRKDIVEEAWTSIASNTNMSVSECKEKWRNIRSSFLRSMRHTGHKIKKPYYLTEYLKFIMPFLKPLSNVENADDSQLDAHHTTTNSDNEIMMEFIKAEPEDFGDNEESTTNPTETVILGDLLSSKSTPIHTTRKRKRFIPTNRRNYTEFVKNRNRASNNNTSSTNDVGNSALRMFLLSMLPELESMSQNQVRLFKIKSMTLIDEIKSNATDVKYSSNSLNTERLQKRLINLLLKNLEQSTKEKIERGDD